MTHKIISLPSGFYAIEITAGENAGMIWQADLIEWDGQKGTGGWGYDLHADDPDNHFRMYIDSKNNVYYTRDDDPGFGCHTWCVGSQLAAHCHYLQQLKWRA